MARKKAYIPSVPHYYTIFQFDGNYHTRRAANYRDADEDLEDVARQGAIPVAIYDVFDWRIDWRLPATEKRSAHEKAVLDLTEELRLKHE